MQYLYYSTFPRQKYIVFAAFPRYKRDILPLFQDFNISSVLPDGWTVETLLSSHRSFPYNPDIANTFFRSGEIEAWGRGIERIITDCKNDGFSTPEFRYDASGNWTIFKFEYPERATTQKTTQNLTEQQAILLFLKEHPEATRKEISDNLPNITEDGVKYNLASLQEIGLLKRIGGRKQGYWEIIE